MRFPLFKRRLRKIFANKQSFWFFPSCLSYYSFFLLPTTQSANNNSRLCISLVLIDSSRPSTLNTVSALHVNFSVELFLDGVPHFRFSHFPSLASRFWYTEYSDVVSSALVFLVLYFVSLKLHSVFDFNNIIFGGHLHLVNFNICK